MPKKRVPRICIIGDGFAAAVGVLRLLRTVPGKFDVTVVGPAETIGRGIAYATPLREHLVNGLAKTFGVVPEQPDHLSAWVEARVAALGWTPPLGVPPTETFVPRQLYGTYVQETLAQELHRNADHVNLAHLRQRAVDLIRDGEGYLVSLANGQKVVADIVVLATGLVPKPPVRIMRDDGQVQPYPKRLLRDPWNPDAWRPLATAREVLIIGSGLTALDFMLSAEAAGFRGRYTLLSRRGLLVQERADVPAWPRGLDPKQLPADLHGLLREVRRIRREIHAQGGHPQQIVSTLRPHLPALWRAASLRDKQRFIRRLRPFWEISLHRAAPVSGQRLAALQEHQRVQQKVGSLLELRDTQQGRVAVQWRPRGATQATSFDVDWVVDAHGYEFDWARIDDPLVCKLLKNGLVRPHATGFGIDAKADTGQLTDVHGKLQTSLLAIGHPLRGVNWESNSIGEQVLQASSAANAIAVLLAGHREQRPAEVPA